MKEVYIEDGSPLTDEDLGAIGKCSKLEKLTFSPGTGELTFLTGLHSLKDLNVLGPLSVEGLTHIGKIDSLEILWFDASSALTDEGLTRLEGLHSLRELLLRGCAGISDKSASTLGKLRSLKDLYLRGTPTGDETLRHLTALELDSLSTGYGVTDEGMDHIAKMTTLRSIRLSGPITDAGLEKLEALPKLEFVDTSGTSITPKGVARFKRKHPKVRVW